MAEGAAREDGLATAEPIDACLLVSTRLTIDAFRVDDVPQVVEELHNKELIPGRAAHVGQRLRNT
jgi:hypothetical protein